MTPLSGQCLCGAVVFELTAVIEAFYYCECRQCRKTTGSVCATNLRLAPTPIDWRHGADNVQIYRDKNGRDFSKAFCQSCGAGLPCLNRTGDALIMPAGCLDTPPPIAVTHRLFTAERPGWAVFAHSLPAYDGFAPTP